MRNSSFLFATVMAVALLLNACSQPETGKMTQATQTLSKDTAEYFNLRPVLEKQYGYTHAVRIGDGLKISDVVSMTDSGAIIGSCDMALQMKNCYKDLEKILQHYGFLIAYSWSL